jgi:hypothetical protein
MPSASLAGPPRVPTFQLPMQLAADGTIATVDQGSSIDVAQRVAVVCSTPRGHFDTAPDLGLYQQRFLKGGADLSEIDRQLDLYVPDADTLVTENLTMLNQALDVIAVRVGGSR